MLRCPAHALENPAAAVTLVSAIVPAFGEEPFLEATVRALLGSAGVDVEVVVVDNGCTDDAVQRVEDLAGVTVLRPGRNLGFAAGCNEGARHSHGDVVALVNDDVTVRPDALARLAEVALRRDVGAATASVRLADSPDRLNSGGNEIHFLGISWSGRFGAAASQWTEEEDVAGASGAAMALKRTLWDALGGLDERYFMYYEDTQMSLRCWQRGLRIVYVPTAVVTHRYQFSKNPQKFFLLERNRLLTVLTMYQGRSLAVLAPAFLALELALLAAATRSGWSSQKIAAWRWLWEHRSDVRRSRQRLQSERTVPDRQLQGLFVDRIDPGNYPVSPALTPLDWLLGAYWRAARHLL